MFQFLFRITFVIFISTSLIGCGQSQYDSMVLAQKGIYDASISPDKGILIGSVQHGASYWKDAERLYNWNHKEGEYSTVKLNAISDSGEFALTADTLAMVMWDVKTGQPVHYWEAPDNLNALTLSPKGNFSLLGMRSHTAVMFDALNGGIKQTFNHKGAVNSVDLNHTGRFALTGSDDFTASLWDIVNGKLLRSWSFDSPVRFVKFSPRSDFVIISPKNELVRLYDIRSGKVKVEFEGLSNYITAALFTEDSKTLYVGDNKNKVAEIDLTDGKIKQTWVIPQKDQFFKTRLSEVLALSLAKEGEDKLWAISSNGNLYFLPLNQ